MGVEPTSEGSTPTHTVLKTGEATGPHPPPRGVASVALECEPAVFRVGVIGSANV
jgi:hypothetical protein